MASWQQVNRLIIGLSVVSLSACATLSNFFSSKNAVSNEGPEGQVVVAIGRSMPVVGPTGRSHWVQMQRQGQAPLTRAAAALAIGEWQVAVDTTRAYLAKHPGDKDAIGMLASSLAMGKQYTLAAFYALQLQKIDAGSTLASNILGIAELSSTHIDRFSVEKARSHFQKAFEMSTGEMAAGLNLGFLELEAGRAEIAYQTFKAVAERCSDCSEASIGWAVAASRIGQYEEARGILQRVVAKNPGHGFASYQLALVQKNGYNDLQAARKTLQTLIADGRVKDPVVKRQANTLLRRLNAQESRTAVAAEAPATNAEAESLLTTGE